MNAAPELGILPPQPYPGLRAFSADEWAIFYGREEPAQEVISLLRTHALVLVHGASGCGKSSLIRAGVLPSLEVDHEIDGRSWMTATMRPSEGPLRRLAALLEERFPRAEAARVVTAGAEPYVAEDWNNLVLKGSGLVEHIDAALKATGGGSLCLLVDQFEEIFRWAREVSSAEARLFIDLLQTIGANPAERSGLSVILTMRSDYLGQCANYNGFAEYLHGRQYLLPKIDEFALLRAIHEPARLYGGAVEPRVAAQLVPIVAAELDGLPVLQHALMRATRHARLAWGPGEGWTVTLDDLSAVGGAANALSQHAEEILTAATAGDPERLEGTEWIFRTLTDLDADRRAIRRPCRLKDLLGASGVSEAKTLGIIDAFRGPDCNFISPYLPAEIDDSTEMDISHEALIRQWDRLSDQRLEASTNRPLGWIYREFQDGLIWRALAVQAEAFLQDRKRVLSAAAAEQRLPWFDGMSKRQPWIGRYAEADGGGEGKVERQWRAVALLMRASRKNLDREKGILSRVKRIRNVGFVFAALSSILAAYWATQASINLRNLQKQSEEVNKIGKELISNLCRINFPDPKGQQFCRVSLTSQLLGNLDAYKGKSELRPSSPISNERGHPANGTISPDIRETE